LPPKLAAPLFPFRRYGENVVVGIFDPDRKVFLHDYQLIPVIELKEKVVRYRRVRGWNVEEVPEFEAPKARVEPKGTAKEPPRAVVKPAVAPKAEANAEDKSKGEPGLGGPIEGKAEIKSRSK
jgi:hypothetical protein